MRLSGSLSRCPLGFRFVWVASADNGLSLCYENISVFFWTAKQSFEEVRSQAGAWEREKSWASSGFRKSRVTARPVRRVDRLAG